MQRSSMARGPESGPPGRAPRLAPPLVHKVLAGPGGPLPAPVRTAMETRLGHDFGRVRIHADEQAAASARGIGAAAYTVGRDVVFGHGRYAPFTAAGDRLLAHELTHTVQHGQRPAPIGGELPVAPAGSALERAAEAGHVSGQQTTGPVLHRAPAWQAETQEVIDARVAAALDEYAKKLGRPVPEWLKDWARRYEAARNSSAETFEAKPLDASVLEQAHTIKRIHGVELPVPQVAQEMKLPPGAVGANEILPFAKGSKVKVTQLLAGVVEKYKDTILSLAAERSGKDPEGIAANAPLLVGLLTDPDVTRKVDATVLESTPIKFDAEVEVPAIPAREGRPPVTARKIHLNLEAADPTPTFDLRIDWGNGRAVFSGITARRESAGKVIVSYPATPTFTLEIGLTRSPGGAVVADIDHFMVRTFLGGQALKLVEMRPLPTAGKPAPAPEPPAQGTYVPSGHGVTFGTGVGFTDKPSSLLTTGWRFTFGVGLGQALVVPWQVQLDYLPGSGIATLGTGVGIEATVAAGSVPLTFTLLPGIKAGAGELGGEKPLPVAGPSLGASAAVGLAPRVRVYMGFDYFHNLVRDSQEKGIQGVPSVQLGSVLQW